MSRRIACIVNPAAGNGRVGQTVELIKQTFRSKGIEAEIHMTTSTAHVKDLARYLGPEHEIIAAVGGDGTVNHVAAGVMDTRAAMAVIPCGSGNDFASLMKIPLDTVGACHTIHRAYVRKIDVGKASLGKEKTITLFVNTLGIGFDASVAYEAQFVPLLKGVPLYLTALAKSLVRFQTVNFDVFDEVGHTISEECFLACIGNGDREGGGFKVMPEASPTDGLLDVCIVTKVPLLRVLSIVRAVLAGRHHHLPDIRYFKTRNVRIRCASPMKVHADGEVWRDSVTEIDVGVMPGRLNVISGEM